MEGELSGRDIVTEPRVVSINCGSSHSLALIETGRGNIVVSWGRGEDGQLGHGDPDEKVVPQAIYKLINAKISEIHCGAEYSIAVSDEDLKVYSWGWGDFGRLGHNDCLDVFVPTPIASLVGTKVSSVACGDTHSLIATSDGKVLSFGRNQNGQLGNGNLDDCFEPKEIIALKDEVVVQVACGAEHSACCTQDGKVFSWGWGRYGNLGDGGLVDRNKPVLVKGLEDVTIKSIACGWRHTLAIDDSGSIFSWGWSKYGQLGHGSTEDELIPKQIHSLRGQRMVHIAGGWRHSLASDESGTLFSWGWNKFGQLGLGNNEDISSPTPVPLPNNEKIDKIASGWRHTLVVSRSGKFFSWGRGINGQLGIGSTCDVNKPVELKELSTGTMSIDMLTKQSHPIVMHSIPPNDRYALVPDKVDPNVSSHTVPEATVPSKKAKYGSS